MTLGLSFLLSCRIATWLLEFVVASTAVVALEVVLLKKTYQILAFILT